MTRDFFFSFFIRQCNVTNFFFSCNEWKCRGKCENNQPEWRWKNSKGKLNEKNKNRQQQSRDFDLSSAKYCKFFLWNGLTCDSSVGLTGSTKYKLKYTIDLCVARRRFLLLLLALGEGVKMSETFFPRNYEILYSINSERRRATTLESVWRGKLTFLEKKRKKVLLLATMRIVLRVSLVYNSWCRERKGKDN